MKPWQINEYPKYASFIRETERRCELPRDMLAKLLWIESDYNVDTVAGNNVNDLGAVGIAGIMPIAGSTLNRRDPLESINFAARYLRILYRQFGNWRYAVMAYRWGAENMHHYLQNDVRKDGEQRGKPYRLPPKTRAQIELIVQ